MTVVTRIAPSPTGDPHLGTAYQALFDFVFARQNGGQFIVRIEDTDQKRYSAESEARILEALSWLGLAHDQGPDVGGPHGPYRQSERLPLYRARADDLLARGAAYRAFETPEELAALRAQAQAAGGVIQVPSRALSPEQAGARAAAGEAHVVRLKVPREGQTVVKDALRGDVRFDNAGLEDAVLLKSDGFPTYHLGVVVDDADMRVTHAVRGEEWISSAPLHVLLYQAFGWPQPVWVHLPLLRNPDKTKLSKRKGNTSLEWFRAQGVLPEALLNYLGMMGWSMPDGREVFGVQDMTQHFSWDRVSLGGSVFDLAKLYWLNGKYLREVLSLDELTGRLHAFLAERGVEVPCDGYFRQVVAMLAPRIETLGEFWDKAPYFWTEDYPFTDRALGLIGDARELLPALRDALAQAEDFSPETTEPLLRGFAEAAGLKPGKVMQPLRAALAGTSESPGMFEMLEALGKERTLARIDRALGQPAASSSA